jgi:hypothetical protein
MKTGTKNVKSIDESIKRIETLTSEFKRKRINSETYIKEVNISLSEMTDERDYLRYLNNIGQF